MPFKFHATRALLHHNSNSGEEFDDSKESKKVEGGK
jgi:hypothetical protein